MDHIYFFFRDERDAVDFFKRVKMKKLGSGVQLCETEEGYVVIVFVNMTPTSTIPSDDIKKLYSDLYDIAGMYISFYKSSIESRVFPSITRVLDECIFR